MHLQLEQIQEQKEGTEHPTHNMVKLSCNMHPITQLTKPDFMESEKSSMIDTTCSILYAMLPMILNYVLNYASALINIYFAGIASNNKQTFAQICFGTVIANVCVFYLIEYVGAGFAIVCSYFSNRQKQQVGYLYQKTLGVTFLICVIMTPMIYLSDKLFLLLGYNYKLVQFACSYAWALVPSFYLCSFIDTNKNYLQSQGTIFPPIVIHFFAATAHFFICLIYSYYSPLGLLGAAWIKNITDCLCALSIYLFIIFKQPTKESWVEWSLKAANNIGRYLKQVFHSQAFTYIEVVSFQILSIIACRLETNEIAAHFSYAIIYIVIYFGFNSLSQCISRAIAISIEQNQVTLCKKRISLGLLLALLFSFILIINLIHYRAHFNELFTDDREVSIEIDNILNLFCIVVGISALNVTMLGIVKTLQLQYIWNYSFVICYILGIIVSIILCYVYDEGVWGIWIGWLLSLFLELYMNLKRVVCLDFQQAFSHIQDRYRVITNDIRASKMEMTYQKQSN